MKAAVAPYYRFFSRTFFNPLQTLKKLRGVPHFARNLSRYRRMNAADSFRFQFGELHYRSYDRFEQAGSVTNHYFYQDLWAARSIATRGIKHHVDVGSRIDGFIAHLLLSCEVTYIDVRPIELDWPGFRSQVGSITEMPFEDNSIPSLSTLHVIEHIGLGRYGDDVDPEGPWKAARELTRVLAPGGTLLVGLPTGRERLCFDAHRVFAPETVRAMFADLELVDFSFLDDDNRFIEHTTFERTHGADIGCGLYTFVKRA